MTDEPKAEQRAPTQTEERDPNRDPSRAHTSSPKPTDFQGTPPDPEADPDFELADDEPQVKGDGEPGVDPDAPQPAASTPPEAETNPIDAAIARITANGLSDRRFAVRVREVPAAIAEEPRVVAAVDRELRMRLLARLEELSGR